jgi:neutral ceramidase
VSGSGELFVGAAKEDITPPVGVFMDMDGYAARRKPSEGNHDKLHARALFLTDGKTSVAMVSCDLCWVSDYLVSITVKKLQHLRSKVDHIIICATHTHSGPAIVDFISPLNHENYQYLKALPDRLADVVFKAEKKAELATLQASRTSVDLSINRRFAGGPVDRELLTITAKDMTGRSIAKIVNFACHGTVLGPENLLVSADYPGVVTNTIEESGKDGLVCLFVNGACGDVNPKTCKGYNCNGSFQDMKATGSILAGRSILSEEVTPINVSTGVQFRSAKIGPFPPFGMEVEVFAVSVGDLMMVGVPGEVFADTGLALKRNSEGFTTLVLAYANGYQGYFPTADAFARGDYEVKELCWVTAEAESNIRNFAEKTAAQFRVMETKEFSKKQSD